MPRRISRRRLVVAALLAVLAVLPFIIHVSVAWYQPVVNAPDQPTIRVQVLGRDVVHFDTTYYQGMRVAVWWFWYDRLWWVPALVAACLVVREFLPIPRVLASDDE
jgi:hypothetical protein